MIIRHDRSDRDSLVDDRRWPALTSFFRGLGGASLIAPSWLLTAAHVAHSIPSEVRLKVEFAGKYYPIDRVVLHHDFTSEWAQGDEDDAESVPDIALVHLEVPVEGVVPFGLYRRSDEQGQSVLLLGRGEFGDGIRGARGIDRALRQATNQIDEVDDYWLKFRFDEPPAGTHLEGVCGEGDSGYPAFIEVGGDLLIAGISAWQRTGERPLGMYGCIEHYTRVSCFSDWIQSICDLPSASR